MYRSYLKPFLNDGGKTKRLEWALRWAVPVPNALGGVAEVPKLKLPQLLVHLDEKWFYVYLQEPAEVLIIPARRRRRADAQGFNTQVSNIAEG